jgi:hexokinase
VSSRLAIYPFQKPDLTLDSGGTNLRVGFIELLGPSGSPLESSVIGTGNAQIGKLSRVRRLLEKSWPIGELLKKTPPEDLFAWVGKCVAEVVRDGWEAWPGELPGQLPMGITFSFPMMFVFCLLSSDRRYTEFNAVSIH